MNPMAIAIFSFFIPGLSQAMEPTTSPPLPSEIEATEAQRNKIQKISTQMVFDDKVRTQLDRIIYAWQQRDSLYEQHKIPLLTPVALCGPPRIGKTTAANELAQVLQTEPYIFSCEELRKQGSSWTIQQACNFLDISFKWIDMQRGITGQSLAVVIFEKMHELLRCSQSTAELLKRHLLNLIHERKKNGLEILFLGEHEEEPPKGLYADIIHIPVPLQKTRAKLLQTLIAAKNIAVPSEIDVQQLAQETEGLLAHDIDWVVNAAALDAIVNKTPKQELPCFTQKSILMHIATTKVRHKTETTYLSYFS